jgi:class 3 adenylate cyclase/predicted ATPase
MSEAWAGNAPGGREDRMQCPTCGFENALSMRFCGKCAAPITKACPECQYKNPVEFSYCGHCGARLTDAEPSESCMLPEANLGKPDAERRQLTVMFCDLVGSTALSQRLDPEDLRDLIAAFRQICAKVVRRCGGRIARYGGDNLIIYFGYPNAHDDDPRMAGRAALQIVKTLRECATEWIGRVGVELQAHIGIHTGLVVAGDLRSGADREVYSIVGETPNVAARLQQMAEPATILISGTTYELIKHQFVCRDIGERQVKGISRPLRVYAALAERALHNSQEAFETGDLTPLEGRKQELALLAQCWERVRDGMGQAALISGDPGIGKSRLVYAFQTSVTDEHSFFACNCSPHSSNSAFLPIIDLLHRQLGFVASDSAAERVAKLEASLNLSRLPVRETLPPIASLLALPLPDNYALPDVSSEAWREKTIEVMLIWLHRQTELRPVIVVVEDIHWADASTLHVITLLLDQVPTARLLLLLTFRPDFHPTWGIHSYVTHVTLSRLSSRDAGAMIDNLSRGTELPPRVREQLAERADGVPLFVEELTKTILESNMLDISPDGNISGALKEASIPATLRDSLMARLDRLNTVKLTLQIAATLGREFSFELLQAVASLTDVDLREALTQLVEREFLFQRGIPPRSSYSFKHALIQEAAYQSLLRASRRQYHLRAAEVVIARFPESAQRQPELIAEHFSLAGAPQRATTYWQLAGEQALTRYANIEAVAHFKKALIQIESLSPSHEREQQEVALLTALGTALTAIKGYGATEAKHIYAQAHALCHTIGDTPQLYPALRGLQSYYQVRGPLESAREIGEQLLRLAERSNDRSLLVEAKRALGWCLFCLGELQAGKEQLEAALNRYDTVASHRNIRAYGSDAGVLGLVNLAWLEWCLGNADRAVESSREAIRLGQVLAHPLSLTYALCMSAAVHQGLRQSELTEELAMNAVTIATENGFSYWIAWGTILRGWAIADKGNVEEGIAQLNEGLAAYRATGAELFRPYSLALLAETYGNAAKPNEGLECIDDAIANGRANNVHFLDAEFFRIKAALLSQNGSEPQHIIEELERAVRTASRQGAKMLELRARSDLAELQYRVGSPEDAQEGITTLLSNISEGAVTADVLRARKILTGTRH